MTEQASTTYFIFNAKQNFFSYMASSRCKIMLLKITRLIVSIFNTLPPVWVLQCHKTYSRYCKLLGVLTLNPPFSPYLWHPWEYPVHITLQRSMFTWISHVKNQCNQYFCDPQTHTFFILYTLNHLIGFQLPPLIQIMKNISIYVKI